MEGSEPEKKGINGENKVNGSKDTDDKSETAVPNGHVNGEEDKVSKVSEDSKEKSDNQQQSVKGKGKGKGKGKSNAIIPKEKTENGKI